MRIVFSIMAVGLLASQSLADSAVIVPRFFDETKSSGVTSVYAGAWEFMVGGGRCHIRL